MNSEKEFIVIEYDVKRIEKFVKNKTNENIVNMWIGRFQRLSKDEIVEFAEKFITKDIPDNVLNIVFCLLDEIGIEKWRTRESEKRVEELRDEIETLKGEKMKLENKVNSLKALGEKKIEEIEKLDKEIKSKRAECDELTDKIKRKKDELNAINKGKREILEEITEANIIRIGNEELGKEHEIFAVSEDITNSLILRREGRTYISSGILKKVIEEAKKAEKFDFFEHFNVLEKDVRDNYKKILDKLSGQYAAERGKGMIKMGKFWWEIAYKFYHSFLLRLSGSFNKLDSNKLVKLMSEICSEALRGMDDPDYVNIGGKFIYSFDVEEEMNSIFTSYREGSDEWLDSKIKNVKYYLEELYRKYGFELWRDTIRHLFIEPILRGLEESSEREEKLIFIMVGSLLYNFLRGV